MNTLYLGTLFMSFAKLSRIPYVLLLSLIFFLSITSLHAASIDKPFLENNVPLALDGFDVVTYFDLTGAKRGTDKYQAVFEGKRYLFSDAVNQQKFAADPERYLPQFDGHCAQSLTMNENILANPEIFTLKSGKLYLFSDEQGQMQWNANSNESVLAANKNWEYKAEKRNAQIKAKKSWKTQNKLELFKF
jgi:YHS domain-containing protein